MWLLWYKGVADQPEVLLDNRVRLNQRFFPFYKSSNIVDTLLVCCLDSYVEGVDEIDNMSYNS